MQLRKDKFYKVLEEKYGVNEDLGASVCNFIMKRWSDWMKFPDNLILYIDFMGTQVLRYKKGKSKYKALVRKIFDFENPENNIFKNEREKRIFLNDQAFLERMDYLLNTKYEEFRKDKKKVQEERYKMQELLPINETPILLRKEIKPIDE